MAAQDNNSTVTGTAFRKYCAGADTPFYYYDMKMLGETVRRCKTAMDRYGYKAHYALKANANPEVLAVIRDAGFGADCVSGNEVLLAVRSGFEPGKIFFAGVGKSDREISDALQAGIACFNCESLQEMKVIDAIAESLGRRARVALRINPGVDAHTHSYISTGREEDKFGICEYELEEAARIIRESGSLDFYGLHFHVGSQITDMGVFRTLCGRVNEIAAKAASYGLEIRNLDLGGGLGIDYENPESYPDFETYVSVIHEHLSVPEGCAVHFEPGRALVAQCGKLVTRVLFVKERGSRNFAITDAGMTDLIRPALYKATHKIVNLSAQGQDRGTALYDIVGPVCESSDCFAKSLEFPVTRRGDILVINSAGAYGEVMAMSYNQRRLPASVTSDDIARLF